MARILSPLLHATKGTIVLDSVLVWFRRDLRNNDHVALAEATRRARKVFCVFVFDRQILDPLRGTADRRVEFIRESLVELDFALKQQGGGLIVRYGFATEEISLLARQLKVSAVFANRDYEPEAKRRDSFVERELLVHGIAFETFKDQVVREHPEVLTASGRPFAVFTPYKNGWLKRLTDEDIGNFTIDVRKLAPPPLPSPIPPLAALGFLPTNLATLGIIAGMSGAQRLLEGFASRISHYRDTRDFPAIKGVSYLSVHLRFGTISIRELVRTAVLGQALNGDAGAATWLSELIWRDFYFMILDCFPHVAERAFKAEFDRIEWETGELADTHFEAWRSGNTGYPLVDAAMRQLNSTGYMHNRLRMVTASFLVKDLGIDWRRGEAYFAAQLNDFDLSANNGGWQWAASSGCDAQPYFRIFNPVTQSERFDPQGKFIRRYLPALANVPDKHIHAPWRMPPHEQKTCCAVIGKDTPAPIVDHDLARHRTLERYAVVKKANGV